MIVFERICRGWCAFPAKRTVENYSVISVDLTDFIFAFQGHCEDDERLYVNRETGKTFLLFADIEGASTRLGSLFDRQYYIRNEAKIRSNVDGYVTIKPLTDAQHREIFLEFLDSDWTDDVLRKEEARSAYESHRLGEYVRALNDSDKNQLLAFRFKAAKERATAIMASRGVNFEWS